MRCASHGRVLEDELTQTVSSEAGVPKVMRPRCGATVMGRYLCSGAKPLAGLQGQVLRRWVRTHTGVPVVIGGDRLRPEEWGLCDAKRALWTAGVALLDDIIVSSNERC